MSESLNGKPWSSSVRHLLQTGEGRLWVLLLILAVLWTAFGLATGGVFFSPINLSNLMSQTAVTGILASGMMLVIVAGKIDLSAGSVLGLVGGVVALLLTEAGSGVPVAVLGALVLAVAIGALHGWLVARAGIPAFIVTLGGLLAWRGVLKWATDAETIPIIDEGFLVIGQQYLDPRIGWLIASSVSAAVVLRVLWNFRSADGGKKSRFIDLLGTVFQVAAVLGFVYLMNSHSGIPIPVLFLLASAGVAHLISTRTIFGRHLYAIGGNAEAARLSGVNIGNNVVAVYALMGLFTGVAALVFSARLESSLPDAGVLKELDAVAACVIGGASLSGGRGLVIGAIIGALIMSTLDNGMGLLGISAFKQEIIKGAILVTAVGIDRFGRTEREA